MFLSSYSSPVNFTESGSHMFLRHDNGKTTVIPNHPREEIGPGLLLKIIKKDLQISREEFENLL